MKLTVVPNAALGPARIVYTNPPPEVKEPFAIAMAMMREAERTLTGNFTTSEKYDHFLSLLPKIESYIAITRKAAK